MTTHHIILGSSSKYRKTLLEKLFSHVECIAPKINERSISANSPKDLALKLSSLKAHNVVASLSSPIKSIVIGSDQVAYCDGVYLHKPGSFEKNCEQLAFCSGKEVSFFTALSVVNTETMKEETTCDLTRVKFKPLTSAQIESYVQKEPSYDCAGGFKVEGLGVTLFEAIETKDPNALIGLPLIELCHILERFGIMLP